MRTAAGVTGSAMVHDRVHDRGTSEYGEEIMDNTSIKSENRTACGSAAIVMFALLAGGCAHVCRGEQAEEMRFSSPEAASHALYLAVHSDNAEAVTSILGTGKGLVSLDDNAQDARDRDRFAQKFRQMHRLVRETDASTVLYVGAENWPFPFPLVFNHGAWHFDAKAGVQEALFRRIGENEARTIQACRTLIMAERQRRTADDVSAPALLDLLAKAGNDGVVIPFHGYYFRTLAGRTKSAPMQVHPVSDRRTPDSHFAFVAYPAEYRVTGVMTYAVNEDYVVYEKDLGANTVSIAKRMTGSYRDPTWHLAQ